MNTRKNIRSRGFSLLEVLIAVVVLSFGLLALANLQASLMRNSGESKARSVALSLAKDRIEDLRSFTSLAEYEAMTDSTGTFTDTAGSLGGVNYTVTTTVQRYAYDPDPDGDPDTNDGAFEAVAADTGALASNFADENEFKTLTVTVGWTDAQGQAQSVTIEDALGSVAPENSGRLARRKPDSAVRKPRVLIRDPSLDAGVIPIAIGDGSETAATNPRPVIDTETAQTSFDIYTYAALLDNSGNAQAQSRVETRVVGCRCDFANADADQTAYRPTYWDGEKYAAPDAAPGSPLSGEATLNGGDPTQSILCSACCRDHHDPIGTSGPQFSPRRDTHAHYDDITGEAINSGEYWEACRMIRSDGIFRVAADPYNEYTNVLKTAVAEGELEPFTDSAPDQTAADAYADFVIEYLKTQAAQASPNDQLSQSAADALAATLNVEPVEVALGSERWMHARGLYMDWLEPEAIEAITEAQTDCPDSLTAEECLLRVLPFTSINVTELAHWTPLQGDGLEIHVANNDFALSELANEGSVNPVRGRVTAVVQGERDATATLPTATVGLLADPDFVIDPTETLVQTRNVADQPDSDGQAFLVEGLDCGFDGTVSLPKNTAADPLVSSSCEGSNNTISLDATRVRLRVWTGGGTPPDTVSAMLSGPGGQTYTIRNDAGNVQLSWSELTGSFILPAVFDPTQPGPWSLVLTGYYNGTSPRINDIRFAVDFIYAQSFTVMVPEGGSAYTFQDVSPSFGSTTASCEGLASTNNPAPCITTAPNVSTTVAITTYNYQSTTDSRAVGCPNNKSDCTTTLACKNYGVTGITRNGATVSLDSAVVTDAGETGETTKVPFGAGFAEGDTVVLTLTPQTDTTPFCSFNGGAAGKCSSYSFSCSNP